MPAIRVEDLGKRYRLGQYQPYRTLRDALGRAVASPLRGFRRQEHHREDELRGGKKSFIWALHHVDLEVEEGDAIGIIGKNGSGKSTLLKILARITAPTEGRVEFRGRVGSMLEVGTGFHPELTGRENVYLNGAVLGMKKREIGARFDRIAQYSGVEDFLDTPVKRYSSGMYVRLAFAVAAHLDPDILLVDEVLSVGDAEFQKRCLETMQGFPARGKTILFVSHNLWAVKSLCRRAVLLEKGQVVAAGATNDVIDFYIGREAQDAAVMGSPTGEAPR